MSAEIYRKIAEKAGVSPQTVQRVLTRPLRDRRPSIVKRTELIRKLAGELNYRPNAAAMAVSTGRFRSVSLLVGGAGRDRGYGWMPRSLIGGLADALQAHDHTLSVAELDDAQFTSDGFLPRALRMWSTDGLIINYISKVPPELLDLIDRHEIPNVWTNFHSRFNCVHPDDALAGRMATEHLLTLGHRRIGYIGWCSANGHYSERDRLAAYNQVMNRAGLEPRVVLLDQGAIDRLQDGDYERYLRRLDRPTAVVAYAKVDVTRLLLAATRLGLSVPRDLSIISFDDEWDNAMDRFPGTCVLNRFAEVGRLAAEMLLTNLDTRRPSEPLTVPPLKIVGHTCAAPSPPR